MQESVLGIIDLSFMVKLAKNLTFNLVAALTKNLMPSKVNNLEVNLVTNLIENLVADTLYEFGANLFQTSSVFQ